MADFAKPAPNERVVHRGNNTPPSPSRPPASTHAGPPEKPKSLANDEIRKKAHERLDQLFTSAESDKLYGTVAIKVSFENGTATILGRDISGTDKRPS